MKIAISVALCYYNYSALGKRSRIYTGLAFRFQVMIWLLGFQPFYESMYPECEINSLADFNINCKMHK